MNKWAHEYLVIEYLQDYYFCSEERVRKWALCHRPRDMLRTNGILLHWELANGCSGLTTNEMQVIRNRFTMF